MIRESPSATSAFLLLVDGRLPTGGHTHSGGIEVAVADGRVHNLSSLRAYLQGRLTSSGLVDAAFAAATWRSLAPLGALNAEAHARCASPALRRASALQGRGLLRAAHRIWPSSELAELDDLSSVSTVMWPVVLGVVARAAALSSRDAALAGAHGSVTCPAWAAVRILGLDPFLVVAILAELADQVDEIARRADVAAGSISSPEFLPANSSPLIEISAEQHANWEVRLFVS